MMPLYRPWPPLFSAYDLVKGPLLIVAPHPDDEVIGAGGLALAHTDRSARVVAAIVTDGAAGDFRGQGGDAYAALRRAESTEAAARLGGTEARFLGFPDGGLRALDDAGDRSLVRALEALMREDRFATIAFPSPFEVHPDHRAVALAALEAAETLGTTTRLLAYEIGEMMPCNLLIDISWLADRKVAALAAFPSQIAHNDLARKVRALNEARSVNCDDPRVVSCEAYLRIDRAGIRAFAAAADSLIAAIDAAQPKVPYE